MLAIEMLLPAELACRPNLEFIFLSLPPCGWDYRCTPPCPAYAVLVNLGLFILGKSSPHSCGPQLLDTSRSSHIQPTRKACQCSLQRGPEYQFPPMLPPPSSSPSLSWPAVASSLVFSVPSPLHFHSSPVTRGNHNIDHFSAQIPSLTLQFTQPKATSKGNEMCSLLDDTPQSSSLTSHVLTWVSSA